MCIHIHVPLLEAWGWTTVSSLCRLSISSDFSHASSEVATRVYIFSKVEKERRFRPVIVEGTKWFLIRCRGWENTVVWIPGASAENTFE
jgi:hypothetical protein